MRYFKAKGTCLSDAMIFRLDEISFYTKKNHPFEHIDYITMIN